MKKTKRNSKTLSHDQLRGIQLKYTSSIEWIKGDRPSYAQAQRKGIVYDVAPHFVKKRITRTKEECLESAKKYKNSKEWQENEPTIHAYAGKCGWKKSITQEAFPDPLWKQKWDKESIFNIAKECHTITDMENRYSGAYDAARRLGLFDELKKVLVPTIGSSLLEKDVLQWQRGKFVDLEVVHKRQMQEDGKRREIDIYFPQINAGIEVDGGYWHGKFQIEKGIDPQQKHKEKDYFFEKLGIDLIHVSEDEWKKDREQAEKKLYDFIQGKRQTAYQKHLRNRAQATSESTNVDLSRSNASVKRIEVRQAETIIYEYEWLKRMPAISQYAYGLFFGEHLAGCVIFSPEYSQNMRLWEKYGFNGKMILLSRGACVHWAPNWANSFLVSRAIRLLPKEYEVVTATIDPAAGEFGTIYQACNFTYVGAMRDRSGNKHRYQFLIDGRIVGTRTIRSRLGTIKMEEVLKYYPTAQKIKQYNKGRYFFFRRNQQQHTKAIEHLIMPYPKRIKSE